MQNRDDARFAEFRDQVDRVLTDINNAVATIVFQRDAALRRCELLEQALRELRDHIGPGIRDEMTVREIDDEVERLAIIDNALRAFEVRSVTDIRRVP